MAPDSIYDLPTRQLYLCHPHAAQLLAIAHFRWLPHEHGTLYHNRFRTRLLFLSSDGNGRLCCSSRPFRLTNNMSRAVYQRRLATLTESDCTVVLQQKCDNAALIIFISTTTTTTTFSRKNFMMMSQAVQELLRWQTDTHTHTLKQTLLKTIPTTIPTLLCHRCMGDKQLWHMLMLPSSVICNHY